MNFHFAKHKNISLGIHHINENPLEYVCFTALLAVMNWKKLINKHNHDLGEKIQNV